MIDSMLNLLFRCSHRRLTRPMAPISKAGTPHSKSYVVCLDCGKQFEYDIEHMRIGKAIEHSNDSGVVPPKPARHGRRLAYGVAAGVLLGMLFGGKKRGKSRNQ